MRTVGLYAKLAETGSGFGAFRQIAGKQRVNQIVALGIERLSGPAAEWLRMLTTLQERLRTVWVLH